LKKVVVVIEGLVEVLFEGKDLKMIDSSSTVIGTMSGKILVVQNGNEQLAVFRDWLYWKKVA